MQHEGLLICVLLASTSLSTGPALAQQAAENALSGAGLAETSKAMANSAAPQPEGLGGSTVQEIIVTAQKRSETLSKVPLSVTAATGAQLKQLGITDPAGLEKIVPGFIFTESTYGAPVYTLRGIGSYDESLAISPAVGVYIDQIPLPFSRMTEGVSLDLQRVEVLKGPQGTLFGENSTGGAVNYIPNSPTDHFEAGGAFTYGRFDETDVEGYISGPVTKEVSARLAFRTEQRGDWQKSYTSTDELGQRHFTTGRLLVDFTPSDTLKFQLNVNGWYDGSDAQALQKIGYAPITPGGYPGAPGFPDIQAQLQSYPNAPANDRAAGWDPDHTFKRNDKFYQIGLRGDWSIPGGVTITSLTGYSHLSVDSPADSDGTPLPNSYVVVFGSIDSVTQELRAAGHFGAEDQLKWVIGANYEYDSSDDNQFVGLHSTNSGIGPFRFIGLYNINDERTNTEAIFTNVDYNITETLKLQGAVRYTNQDRSYHGGITDDGSGGLARAFSFLSTTLSGTPTVIPPGGYITLDPVTNKPLTNGIFKKLDEDNVSWKLGLSWTPTTDLLLYANVTKGYKSGAFGTLPALRPAQADPVPQESVLAYEVGFKAAALQHRLQVSGALFKYDYRDKQLLASANVGFPFGTLPALVSVPKSEVDGAELDLNARPIRGLTLRLGGTYVYSKVRGSYVISGPTSGPPIDIGGESFPSTPRWQLNSDVEYEYPILEEWNAFVGVNVSYRSDAQGVFGDIPTLQLPSYALVDLRAGVEHGKWRIELWGRNVTDQYYWNHAFRATDTITRTAGMPATYGVTLSAKF